MRTGLRVALRGARGRDKEHRTSWVAPPEGLRRAGELAGRSSIILLGVRVPEFAMRRGVRGQQGRRAWASAVQAASSSWIWWDAFTSPWLHGKNRTASPSDHSPEPCAALGADASTAAYPPNRLSCSEASSELAPYSFVQGVGVKSGWRAWTSTVSDVLCLRLPTPLA